MFGAWFMFKWSAIAIILVAVATFSWSAVDSYNKMVTQVAVLKAEVKKYDGRLASYKRMIERRDEAIEASTCKTQIKYWVSNPDKVPKKFEPFKNSPLSTELPDSTKQPNRLDTDPVPPIELPKLNLDWPWNWSVWK